MGIRATTIGIKFAVRKQPYEMYYYLDLGLTNIEIIVSVLSAINLI